MQPQRDGVQVPGNDWPLPTIAWLDPEEETKAQNHPNIQAPGLA